MNLNILGDEPIKQLELGDVVKFKNGDCYIAVRTYIEGVHYHSLRGFDGKAGAIGDHITLDLLRKSLSTHTDVTIYSKDDYELQLVKKDKEVQ